MAEKVEVKIDGLPLVSSEEWAKARLAPEADLPQIDPSRYVTSRRLGLPIVADARREYAWELARKRMLEQGKMLATRLEAGVAYPLRYIVWDGSRREWIAVPNSASIRPISLTADLVDRITNWGTQQDFNELLKAFEGYGAVA
jgi:hypothetical protein